MKRALLTIALLTFAVSCLSFQGMQPGPGFKKYTAGAPSGDFDIVGATYFAVAPAGYSYSGTETTNYSTRKYNTLSAAEAALAASPSTPQVINIIGTWSSADTTAVTIDGTTTTAANYILIRTNADARHSGIYSTDHYRIENTAETELYIRDTYTTVEGLAIENAYTGTSVRKPLRIQTAGAGTVHVSHSIISIDMSADPIIYAISIEDNDAIFSIFNNIIYGLPTASASRGISLGSSSTVAYVYNNTIVTAATGIALSSNTTTVLKNNVALACTDGYSGTAGTGSTNNASSVASDLDIDLTTATITDYFESATDYHIKTAGTYASELIGQGADLDADPNIAITDDIDGDARHATTPDLGADED